jgi:hypothetical protein
VTLAGSREVILKSAALFRQAKLWNLVVLLVGVLAFSAALAVDQGRGSLVALMRGECMAIGIPLVFVIMLIPFISGLVTGIAMGYVGTSFPLVFALLGTEPPFRQIAAATVLAFGFGYVGMMLSPVHICFVVTSRYFDTTVFSAYRYLWGPALAILGASAILAGAYYALL